MELSSQWATALELNILKWMHEGFEMYPDSTTEVFNIINESAASYKFHDSWGPKQIPKSSEGAATTELNRQKGYETQASPQVFKGKVSATWEWERWNKYPEIEQSSKDLGKAAIYSTNLLANGVFIRAFSTSKFLGGFIRKGNVKLFKLRGSPEVDNPQESLAREIFNDYNKTPKEKSMVKG